jgi:glycine/D-amino acid oxidase-like deaminating enzyme
MKRRDVLKMSMLAPAAAVTDSLIPPQRTGPRVVVIGAGAFGGWTALELTRRGARVTLIDAWGPGNVRASSGGETRVIRATYGTRAAYTDMAARALVLWRAYDQRWQRTFFRQTGALWMFGRDDSFGRASRDALRARDMPVEELSRAEAGKRFPQIRFDGIEHVLFESDAGYLLARRACEHVVERLIAEGGTYRVAAAASPIRIESSPARHIALEDGERLEADHFVCACGPWLGTLFPDVIGQFLKSTKQEVYYFGTPAGDDRFSEHRLPVWVDFRDRLIYGIPGNAHRGFKLADDMSGPIFDPTNGERDVGEAGISRARAFVAERFPALARAPLVGSEVCQYESTPDSNFIIDHHPAAANVWIAGGGSGHGYKMGPAIGEMVASLVLGEGKPDPMFALRRFAAPPREGWQDKWS